MEVVIMFNEWKRTEKSLKDQFRGKEEAERIPEVMSLLPSLVERCGQASNSRVAVLKIARALVATKMPRIYVPTCPDYGHDGKRYTFQGLNAGVSLLSHGHIEFLAALREYLPHAQVSFLIADQEAQDEEIVRAVGVSVEMFEMRVRGSLEATRARVAPYGWTAELMTKAIPDLLLQERAITERIRQSPAYESRLRAEASKRRSLYERVNPHMSIEHMLERTARTAAQYVAMGEFVAGVNALVCNHTTTNLAWYGETPAGLLHNPISVY